jgi:hypothetical protein
MFLVQQQQPQHSTARANSTDPTAVALQLAGTAAVRNVAALYLSRSVAAARSSDACAPWPKSSTTLKQQLPSLAAAAVADGRGAAAWQQ